MKNIQNLTIDINKKPFQTITANVGEVASRFIRITILENNMPADLTGVTAYLYAKKADGTKVFNSVKVEDAKKGIVLAELTSQVLAVAGLTKLTLLLTKDGAKLASKQIIVTVDESNIDEEAIQSSNEFNAFTNALRNINNIDNKVWSMANMGQDVKEAMTGGSVAVVGKNTVLAENIVDGQVTEDKVSFLNKVNPLNLFNSKSTNNQIDSIHKYNGTIEYQRGMIVTHKILVKEGKQYTLSRIQGQWGGFYSSSGTLIQSIGVTGDNRNYTITAPTGASYMLLNCYSSDIDTYMVVEGNIMPSVYVPYAEKPYSLSESIMIPKLEEMKEQVDNTSLYIKKNVEELKSLFVKYNNLFDKNNSDVYTGGYFTSFTGGINEYDKYMISHFIEVEEGKNYCYPANTSQYGSNNKIYVCYDENKEVINAYDLRDATVDTDNDILHIKIPKGYGVKYIRVNLHQQTCPNFMIVEGDEYPSEFIPYGFKMSDDIEFSDSQKAEISKISTEVIANSTVNIVSPLAYKTITFNGDSICQGNVNGGGYGKIIAERYNMNYQNVAISGGTITAEQYISSTGHARHWISRTISKMRDDADYVVLEGGVNDASLNVPLGEITSDYKSELDDTTYCGAFESMLKQVLEKYPGKKIGYILVHKMDKNFDSRYENNHYQASKQICEKWGVPYLDLNIECPPLNYIQSLKEAYTTNSDGWHPNVEGYEKYYVPKILAWLERL